MFALRLLDGPFDHIKHVRLKMSSCQPVGGDQVSGTRFRLLIRPTPLILRTATTTRPSAEPPSDHPPPLP